jgi:2-phosphoglycerate kinase
MLRWRVAFRNPYDAVTKKRIMVIHADTLREAMRKFVGQFPNAEKVTFTAI